jgi:hypothetical protein
MAFLYLYASTMRSARDHSVNTIRLRIGNAGTRLCTSLRLTLGMFLGECLLDDLL